MHPLRALKRSSSEKFLLVSAHAPGVQQRSGQAQAWAVNQDSRQGKGIRVPNFGGLVLGCIEADFAREYSLQDFFEIYKCTHACSASNSILLQMLTLFSTKC